MKPASACRLCLQSGAWTMVEGRRCCIHQVLDLETALVPTPPPLEGQPCTRTRPEQKPLYQRSPEHYITAAIVPRTLMYDSKMTGAQASSV
jgi:hypothetical protein